MLVAFALGCRGEPAPGERAAGAGAPQMPLVFAQVKEVELRAQPDPGAPVVGRLFLGDEPVGIAGWTGAFVEVAGKGPGAAPRGWAPARHLGTERPSVESLLARHDATPDQDRRKELLEMARAMASSDVRVLKRLLALHRARGDRAAAKQVEEELEAARVEPPIGNLALVMSDAVGRAQPTALSKETASLRTGTVVVLGEGPSYGWDGTWQQVRFDGAELWVPQGAALPLGFDLYHVETYQEGTEGETVRNATRNPQADALLSDDFFARAAENPAPFARRQMAAVLLGFLCEKSSGPVGPDATEGEGYPDIVLAWSRLQGDPDAEVRRRATAALAECVRGKQDDLRLYPELHLAVAEEISSGRMRTPAEKKELRRLVKQFQTNLVFEGLE